MKTISNFLMFSLFSVLTLMSSCKEDPIASNDNTGTQLTGNKGGQSSVKASAKITVPGANVTTTAPLDPGNPKENIVDGSTATRWSGLGDPQSITLDLGDTYTVDYVKIAFHTAGSTTRTSNFDVAVSADNLNWTTVLSNQNSTPNNTALQTFDFTNTVGKYVKITGHGNTDNQWNSYTEVEVWGEAGTVDLVGDWETGNYSQWDNGIIAANIAQQFSAVTTPVRQGTYAAKFVVNPGDQYCKISGSSASKFTVGGSSVTTTAPLDPGNPKENVVDGSTATRWSGLGNPQSITLDLGSRRNVEYVKIAFHTAGSTTRTSNFDIAISNDNVYWTTVLANQNSAPNSTALQTFDFTDTKGRYVRITGHGNTDNQWNSYTEVEAWGRSLTGCTSGERSEANRWNYDRETINDEYYYGWSTYFPTDWAEPTGWGIFMQWHAHTSISPPIAFNARANSVKVEFNTGSIVSWYPAEYGSSHTILSNLNKGSWNDFIVRIRFRPDYTGIFEVWHRLEGQADFTKVLSLTSVPTLQWTSNSSQIDSGYGIPFVKGGVNGWTTGCYLQHGLYRGATSAGGIINTIYQDNWSRGTSYASVRARF